MKKEDVEDARTTTSYPPSLYNYPDDSLSQEQTNNVRRKSLHVYYDYLLGEDAWKRIVAATNWMTWEMSVSRMTIPNKELDEQ